MAYQSNQSGRTEVYVRPFPGKGAETAVSVGGGFQPRWRADGKELYYVSPDGKLMAVPIAVHGDSIEPGRPVVLFQMHMAGGADSYSRENYDVAKDGRFLIETLLDDVAMPPLTLVLN